MDKQNLEEALKILSEMELENMTDNFEEIVPLVQEYKDKYGHNSFIDEYIETYLQIRQINKARGNGSQHVYFKRR